MKLAEPISKLFLACVLAVGMGAAAGGLVRAITPEAKAQIPACKFGSPTFSWWDVQSGGVTYHGIGVTATCGGGMTSCKARCAVLYWIWDPVGHAWIAYGNQPDAMSAPVTVFCGNTYNCAFYVPGIGFPAGSTIRMELVFYEWVGGAWNAKAWDFNQWTNP